MWNVGQIVEHCFCWLVVSGATSTTSAPPAGTSSSGKISGATGPNVIPLPIIDDLQLPPRFHRRRIDRSTIFLDFFNFCKYFNLMNCKFTMFEILEGGRARLTSGRCLIEALTHIIEKIELSKFRKMKSKPWQRDKLISKLNYCGKLTNFRLSLSENSRVNVPKLEIKLRIGLAILSKLLYYNRLFTVKLANRIKNV